MTRPGEDLHELDVALPDGRDPEAPVEDAFEQATPAQPARLPAELRLPYEASEADAYDQSQVVDLDDEY
jgi:hypothetical protein